MNIGVATIKNLIFDVLFIIIIRGVLF